VSLSPSVCGVWLVQHVVDVQLRGWRCSPVSPPEASSSQHVSRVDVAQASHRPRAHTCRSPLPCVGVLQRPQTGAPPCCDAEPLGCTLTLTDADSRRHEGLQGGSGGSVVARRRCAVARAHGIVRRCDSRLFASSVSSRLIVMVVSSTSACIVVVVTSLPTAFMLMVVSSNSIHRHSRLFNVIVVP
jgi:hypothetical protein